MARLLDRVLETAPVMASRWGQCGLPFGVMSGLPNPSHWSGVDRAAVPLGRLYHPPNASADAVRAQRE